MIAKIFPSSTITRTPKQQQQDASNLVTLMHQVIKGDRDAMNEVDDIILECLDVGDESTLQLAFDSLESDALKHKFNETIRFSSEKPIIRIERATGELEDKMAQLFAIPITINVKSLSDDKLFDAHALAQRLVASSLFDAEDEVVLYENLVGIAATEQTPAANFVLCKQLLLNQAVNLPALKLEKGINLGFIVGAVCSDMSKPVLEEREVAKTMRQTRRVTKYLVSVLDEGLELSMIGLPSSLSEAGISGQILKRKSEISRLILEAKAVSSLEPKVMLRLERHPGKLLAKLSATVSIAGQRVADMPEQEMLLGEPEELLIEDVCNYLFEQHGVTEVYLATDDEEAKPLCIGRVGF